MNSQPHSDEPRIAPGTREQIGLVNTLILAVGARVSGSKSPPHVMTTIARHRRLFRAWVRFASTLMPRGTLERADTELAILRVAHLCGSEYEWSHHALIAGAVGLSADDVESIRRDGAASDRWEPRQAALLRTVDQLHAEQQISDELWTELSSFFDEQELIEICMLIGHYHMVAMTLNGLRVANDAGHSAPRLPPQRRRRGSKRG